MSNGLMIDTPESGVVNYEQVVAVPVPPKTKSYTPVPYAELLQILEREAGKWGLALTNPNYGLARLGQRLFGTFDVVGQDHFDNRVKLMLGFRSSYDKSLANGVCFGSTVFVCSNLIFTGYAGEEGIVGSTFRKHTVNVFEGLVNRLHSSFNQFGEFKDYQEKFYNRLEDTPIDNCRVHDLIVKAVLADAVPNKEVVRLAQHWYGQGNEPECEEAAVNWHREFQPRNAWSLLNTFTENAKVYQKQNPVEANKRAIQVTNLFHKEFNTN